MWHLGILSNLLQQWNVDCFPSKIDFNTDCWLVLGNEELRLLLEEEFRLFETDILHGGEVELRLDRLCRKVLSLILHAMLTERGHDGRQGLVDVVEHLQEI